MDTNQIDVRIQELLQRNIFLKESLLPQIQSTSPEKQLQLLPVLEQMDEKQTEVFQKVLEKNPDFFKYIKRKKNHENLMKLLAIELKEKQIDMEKIEIELLEKLKELA